jgi:ferrous iron transport protein A
MNEQQKEKFLQVLRILEEKKKLKQLHELKKGQKAIIKDIIENELTLKLMDMGCLPGEEITMIGKAPMGDPMMFLIGTYILSLRKEEAGYIQVQPIN